MERALVKALTALVFIAGADLALKRFRLAGKLKMTKEELKREHKEEEGDPLIRSRRRRQHREIARGRVAAEVPRADVVVVNPTHIAVALRYRPGEDRAPRVTAKGKGEQAENIRDLARENGIPIVENIPLARLLYKRVKVGRTIPAETFKAVAAILAFVYRALGRTSGQRGPPMSALDAPARRQPPHRPGPADGVRAGRRRHPGPAAAAVPCSTRCWRSTSASRC